MEVSKHIGTGVQSVTVTLDVNEMLVLKTKVLMFRQSAKDGAINDALLRGKELCNFMNGILPISDVDLEDVHYRLFSEAKKEEQDNYDLSNAADVEDAVKPFYIDDVPSPEKAQYVEKKKNNV